MKLTTAQIRQIIAEELQKVLMVEGIQNLVRYPQTNGWELYARLVADAYKAAPLYDEEAVESFKILGAFYEKMYPKITRKAVKPRPVDYHPYDVGGGVEDTTSVHRLRKDYKDTGGFEVARVDSEHPVYSPDENVRARVIHDYMSHIQPRHAAGFSSPTEPGSILQEIKAYNIHLKTIPPKGAPALFTEVLGQVCHFYVYGDFIEQKVAFLPGFDYHNPGIVYPETGYKNSGRILVPIQKQLPLDSGE